eukprot:5819003-Amphidinium_carterae.1
MDGSGNSSTSSNAVSLVQLQHGRHAGNLWGKAVKTGRFDVDGSQHGRTRSKAIFIRVPISAVTNMCGIG